MVWVVYNNATGKIIHAASNEELAVQNRSVGESIMNFPDEGFEICDSKKVQDGALVEDTELIEFLAGFTVRDRRNEELEEMDKIITSPLRWDALTDEKKAEWAQYRQDLLDVPQQSGFPLNINWPEKPD